MKVFIGIAQASTPVSDRGIVEKGFCRTVEQEPIALGAQSPRKQASLPQPVTNFFRRVLLPLAAFLQDSIDFSGDLSHQDLLLAGVAQGERSNDSERSEFVNAFGVLVIGDGHKQGDELRLEFRRINDASAKRIRNQSYFG